MGNHPVNTFPLRYLLPAIMKTLLIYGANGYTGRLICEEAKKHGLSPVLAGRDRASIASLAESYGWEYRVFGLDDAQQIATNMAGIDVVIHAAGPFRFTAEKMIQACIEAGVHYLDINGEVDVFAMAQSMHDQAFAKNIMLLPGAGFDVVPTDCLALYLSKKMPDATQLELAFVTPNGQVSHGTAMSMSEKLGEGGASRKDGKLVKEPIGHKSRYIQAGEKKFFVMSIPWGDVFTSFHTTGIRNMHAFTGFSPILYNLLKIQFILNPIFRTRTFKKWMQKKINARPAGPTPEQRAGAKSYVWGEVTNASGTKLNAWYACPDGYTLTAYAAVDIARRVLNGDWKPGYQTPAGCYGVTLMAPYIMEGEKMGG
jgi:short subunit dehydrogenase-like uncharacterized protein